MPAGSPALDDAVRALARRDLTASGLADWLKGRGVAEDERAEILATLLGAGYLDDARFAAERAQRLAERGYGDSAIRIDLERKGVDADLVDEAVGGLYAERERAERLVKKLGGGTRALRALERKGFARETLESLLAEGIAEQG